MKYLLLILTLCTFFACKSSEQTKTANPPIATEKPIEFNVIKSGTNGIYKSATELKIEESAKLDAVWAELFKNYSRQAPIPIVDFTKNSVIVVTMGEQNSGGHSIKISSVSETDKAIIVNIEESKPGSTCITTSVMTYPFQLIEIPKSDKKFIFNRTKKVIECE